MKKTVSRIVSAALAIALTAGMTACASGTGNTSSTGSEASANTNSASTNGVTHVKFWHYMQSNEGVQTQKIVDAYNQSQNKVKVDAQYVPTTELMKQYTIGAVSGDLPDIGICDNPDNASYVSMGVCEDITDLFNAWGEAKFLEGPLASCKLDGKVYGLPFTSNCLGLYYDADVLQKAGVKVPATWSELTAACKKLTQGTQKGLAFSAVAKEEGTFQFMPFLLSAGGDINDLSSANSVKALDYFSGLIKSGYVSKECINWTQADVEKQFASGSAAMMINGPWNLANIKKDAPNKNWKVAKIPKDDNGNYASVLGGENIIMCKGAKKDAAWDFLKYIDSKDNSQKFCESTGYLSPRSDIKGAEMFKDNANMAVFADMMPTAKSRGPHVKWPEVSSAIQNAMQESITGKATAQQAMAGAKAKVDKINANLKK